MPQFTAIDLSLGIYESAPFSLTDGKLTLEVEWFKVDPGAQVEVLQDGGVTTGYDPILDDKYRSAHIWCAKGSGRKTINIVGVYNAFGIVRVTPGKAPPATGLINSINVINV